MEAVSNQIAIALVKATPKKLEMPPLKAVEPLAELPALKSWSSLSDSEVLNVARIFVSREKISSRTEVAKKYSRLYRQLCKRGLFDALGFALERPIASFGDTELIAIAKRLKEEGRFARKSHFQKKHYAVYFELKKRGLVHALDFEKVAENRKGMGNAELAAQANQVAEKENIASVAEFQKKHRALYKALCDRGIHHMLKIERRYVDWSRVPDSGLLEIARQKIEGRQDIARAEFKKEFPGIYKQLKKRNLLEEAGIRATRTPITSLEDSQVVSQAKEFIDGQGISSISGLQKAPGGWRWYAELSKRGLLSAAGLSPKLVRWGKLSAHELAVYANKEIHAGRIFTAEDLRQKNQKLYQAINSYSKTSPGIWLKINLLSRERLSRTSENPPDASELRAWLRKFVERDGILSQDELKRSCKVLYDAFVRNKMDVAQEISALFPVPNPKRGRREANRLLEEHLGIIPIIIKKRRLSLYLPYPEAEQIARLSIYKSSFRWDGSGSFREYAIRNSIECWRMVYQESERIHVSAYLRAQAEHYSKWKSKNPDGSFEEYASVHEIPKGKRESLREGFPKHMGSLFPTGSGKVRPENGSCPEPMELAQASLSNSLALPHAHGMGFQNPEESLSYFQLKREAYGLLKLVSKKEKKIVSMYFGLNGFKPHLFSQIGEKYNVSKQRIEQIVSGALKKLAKKSEARRLFEEFP